MSTRTNIHGTALLLGTTGVLLRGASGSGKSLLALALLDRWESRGLPARLIADDRVDLTPTGRSIVMSTPPTIVGLIELRGRGPIKRPYTDSAPLDLVIDLVAELVRMPEEGELLTEIIGAPVARAPVPNAGVVDVAHQIMLVAAAIEALSGDSQGS